MAPQRITRRLWKFDGDTSRESVIELAHSGPFMEGDGNIDYVCAHCDNVLARGLDESATIARVIIKCGKCGKLSNLTTPNALPK